MAKNKIRIAMIGCGGNMRGAHVPRLHEDGKVELVAVVDTEEAPARLLMEKYGREVPWYTDHKTLLRKEKLDAIFISSPHASHYAQVKAALEHDLHVLVEKPLTITSAKAKALIALAEKRKRFLQVSYQRNYYAPHTYARDLVAKGALGEIRGVVAYVTQNWSGVRGWRLVPELSGGGMFFDTGSHLVASTLWISGLQPAQVSAFVDNEGKDVDIKAVVNVRFKNGALGTLNTFGSASRHDERLAIHGSEGCLVFHLHQWQIKSVLLNDQPLEIPPRIKEDNPDAALFRWMRNGGKGYEQPWFALEVARLSEAAYKSAALGKPVKVAS
ncbi:MAG: Gfo/Idh/MocA family oxidoreductase [Candidatus Latescibacteria bacterium]|nr:Gfo/Idh/MocA family oxidoreductase [Candidatus Latescibacterota bacterium]